MKLSCILLLCLISLVSKCDTPRRILTHSEYDSEDDFSSRNEIPVSADSKEKKTAALTSGDEVVPEEGLMAWYKFEDYSDEIWKSSVGTFEMTILKGKEHLDVISKRGYGSAVKVQSLSGSYKTQVTFGRILAQDYTICSITRYAGDRQARILMGSRGTPTSQKGNWLHGHWAGRIGVARYENWGTYRFSIKDLERQSWLVMCGQNLSPRNLIRANGRNVIAREPGDGPWHVSINTGDRDDTSDWAIMELITWNRRLRKDEMTAVEKYLLNLLRDPVKLQKKAFDKKRKDAEKEEKKDAEKEKKKESSKEKSVGEYFSDYDLNPDDLDKWRRRKLQYIEDDIAQATQQSVAVGPADTQASPKMQAKEHNEAMSDAEQIRKEELAQKKAEREKDALQSKESEAKEEEKDKFLLDKYEDVPREGMVAWYRYKNFDKDKKRWKAHKGEFEMKIISGRGTIEHLEKPGFGTNAMIGAVSGSTTSGVTFGEIIKKDFTICSITRYTGSQQARILSGSFGKDSTSTRGNWFHGHWEGKVGVAHYEGWFTEYERIPQALADSYQWIWMCGQSSVGPNFRANGLNIRRDRRGDGPYFLNVNHGGLPALRLQQSSMDTRPDSEKSKEDKERDRKGAEVSDWAVAEIITWNRRLDASEMKDVEAYLESELKLSNIPAHRGKKYGSHHGNFGNTNTNMAGWHGTDSGDGIDSKDDVKDTMQFNVSPTAGDPHDPAHQIPLKHQETASTTRPAALPEGHGPGASVQISTKEMNEERAVSDDEYDSDEHKVADDPKKSKKSKPAAAPSSDSDSHSDEDDDSEDDDDSTDVGTYDDPYNNQLYMLEDAVSSEDYSDSDDDDDDDEEELSTYDDPYNNQLYMVEEEVGDSLEDGLNKLEVSGDLDSDFMDELKDLNADLQSDIKKKKGDDKVGNVQDLVGNSDEEDLGTYDDPHNNQMYMVEQEVAESREMADFRRFLKHREFDDLNTELYFDYGPGPDEDQVGVGYLDDDDLVQLPVSEDYSDKDDLDDGFEDQFKHLGDGAVSLGSLRDVDDHYRSMELPESVSSHSHHQKKVKRHSKKKEVNVSKKKMNDDYDDPDAAEEAKYKKLNKREKKKRSSEKAVSSDSREDIINKFLNDLHTDKDRPKKSSTSKHSALKKLAAAEKPLSGQLVPDTEINVKFDEVAIGGDRRRGGIPKDGMIAWFQYSNFDEKKQEWKSSLGEGNEQHKMKINTGFAHTLEAREFGARAKVGAVAGNWSTSVTFGPIIKEDFTICSISRYTGQFKNRILQGSFVDDDSQGNWVHGHWADRAAVAYYEKWKTSRDNKLKKITDWLIMCGQNDEHPVIHANGLNVANHNIKSHDYNININCCGCCHKEGSDWAVAEIMTWDRHLSLLELAKVERYLKRILAEGLDFQEQSAKWDCELDLTTFSGQNVLEKNLNWYVGKDEEHLMIDFKKQQDDLSAKDLLEKTQKQKLKEKLAKEQEEFEAEELARKKKKIVQLKEENAEEKAKIEQKQKEKEQIKKNGGKPLKSITKRVSFPGDYDKIVVGKKALFLKECSKSMRPVVCSDVEKGSVVVTMKSTSSSDLSVAVSAAVKKGLKMENFELPPGKVIKSKEEENEENEESCKNCDKEKDEEADEKNAKKKAADDEKKEEEKKEKKEEDREQAKKEQNQSKKSTSKQTKKDQDEEGDKKEEKGKDEEDEEDEENKDEKDEKNKEEKKDEKDEKNKEEKKSDKKSKKADDEDEDEDEDVDPNKVTKMDVKFDVEFDKVVKGKEKEFLSACSKKMGDDVECVGVKAAKEKELESETEVELAGKGGVVITIKGKVKDMKKDIKKMSDSGLKLSGFGDLGSGKSVPKAKKKEDEKKEETKSEDKEEEKDKKSEKSKDKEEDKDKKSEKSKDDEEEEKDKKSEKSKDDKKEEKDKKSEKSKDDKEEDKDKKSTKSDEKTKDKEEKDKKSEKSKDKEEEKDKQEEKDKKSEKSKDDEEEDKDKKSEKSNDDKKEEKDKKSEKSKDDQEEDKDKKSTKSDEKTKLKKKLEQIKKQLKKAEQKKSEGKGKDEKEKKDDEEEEDEDDGKGKKKDKEEEDEDKDDGKGKKKGSKDDDEEEDEDDGKGKKKGNKEDDDQQEEDKDDGKGNKEDDDQQEEDEDDGKAQKKKKKDEDEEEGNDKNVKKGEKKEKVNKKDKDNEDEEEGLKPSKKKTLQKKGTSKKKKGEDEDDSEDDEDKGKKKGKDEEDSEDDEDKGKKEGKDEEDSEDDEDKGKKKGKDEDDSEDDEDKGKKKGKDEDDSEDDEDKGKKKGKDEEDSEDEDKEKKKGKDGKDSEEDDDKGKKGKDKENSEEDDDKEKKSTKGNAEQEAKKEKNQGPSADDKGDKNRRERKATKTKDPEDKKESKTERDQEKKNDPDRKKPKVDKNKANEGKKPTKQASTPKDARGKKEDSEKKDKPAEPSRKDDKQKKSKKASKASDDNDDENQSKKQKQKDDQVIPSKKKKDKDEDDSEKDQNNDDDDNANDDDEGKKKSSKEDDGKGKDESDDDNANDDAGKGKNKSSKDNADKGEDESDDDNANDDEGKEKKKSSKDNADKGEDESDDDNANDDEGKGKKKSSKDNADNEAKKEKNGGPSNDEKDGKTRRERKSTKTKDPEDKEESDTKRDQQKKNDPDGKQPEVDKDKASEGKKPSKEASTPKQAKGKKEDSEKKDKPAEPSRKDDKQKKSKKASTASDDDGDENQSKKQQQKDDQVISKKKKDNDSETNDEDDSENDDDSKSKKKKNADDSENDDDSETNKDATDGKKTKNEDDSNDEEADDKKKKSSDDEDDSEENLSVNNENPFDDPVDFGVEVGASLQNDLSNTHAALSLLVALSLFALSGISFCVCHVFSCQLSKGDSIRTWFDQSYDQYSPLQEEEF